MRRHLFAIAAVAVVILVVAGALVMALGNDGTSQTVDQTSVVPGAGGGTTTAFAAGGTQSEAALYAKGVRVPANAVKKADIVVFGTVTRVDPGRWNSPDGKPWTPPSESDIPSIYRTFYVEPIEILKGEPKWGTPVAFQVTGGTEGVVDGPVAVGDKVLVIGFDYEAHGSSLYGQVYWKKDAYFPMHMEFSIFVEKDGRLQVLATEKNDEANVTDLSTLRAAIANASSGASARPSSPTTAP